MLCNIIMIMIMRECVHRERERDQRMCVCCVSTLTTSISISHRPGSFYSSSLHLRLRHRAHHHEFLPAPPHRYDAVRMHYVLLLLDPTVHRVSVLLDPTVPRVSVLDSAVPWLADGTSRCLALKADEIACNVCQEDCTAPRRRT
jgi:hypothetical protein